MSTNYKPFKNLKQMMNQPASKHWFARNKLTEQHGFNGLAPYKPKEKKSKAKALNNFKK